jgi:RNase P/RNase MRP subunit p30
MPTDILSFKGKNEWFDNTTNINELDKLNIKIAEGNGFESNRKAVENKQLDILLSPEKGIEKDSMHHRNSGLNHVACKIAKKNNVAIGFSFNEILNAKDKAAQMGRMMQNVKLCRKYKLKMVFASFAKNKWEIRSSQDLLSFAKLIGMSDKEAKEAFKVIDEIIKRKKDKWVRKGVKILE